MGNLDKIRQLCKEIDLPKGKLTDEFLFSIDMADLFFYGRNIGQRDIASGFTDGANDGGIDFIFDDSETMYLIQGKSSENMAIEDVKNAFYKMIETYKKFDDNDTSGFSDKLKSVYWNSYDNLNDDKNIEFVLFTNTVFSSELKSKYQDFAKQEDLKDYTLRLYDLSDIQNKEASVYQESDLIPYDKVKLYMEKTADNQLSYGENGIIVNISAASLKHLFEKYEKKGLFSYNLREHIVQKSVDDAIDDTIKNDKDNFWFYNNGITIGCADYEKDGNEVKLYDFSIINGAQTTTKVGKSKIVSDSNDFAIVCKIVKAPNSVSDDEDFISRISEASNSQKPIKQRDLKANSPEQKMLQMGSAQNGKYSLSIEIKRGVKPKNYKKVEKWQRVTNENIGMLILACILQSPGPAKNGRTIIFSSTQRYKKIFLRKHDYDTLYDLVRLSNMFDEFMDEYVSKDNNLDTLAIAKNGKYTILAVISYLCKKQRGIVSDRFSDNLNKDNLKGLLITKYKGDDLEKRVNDLFRFIIKKLGDVYNSKKDALKLTSYSNFFKMEQAYTYVLESFDVLDDYDKDKLDYLTAVFEE